MTTNRLSAISLALSAVTLAIVLSLAVRPTPPDMDLGPSLSAVESEVSEIRADIAALRDVLERPTATADTGQHAGIEARLDSLDSAVGGIAAKFTALCNAVNSSPFSPPGGAC